MISHALSNITIDATYTGPKSRRHRPFKVKKRHLPFRSLPCLSSRSRSRVEFPLTYTFVRFIHMFFVQASSK